MHILCMGLHSGIMKAMEIAWNIGLDWLRDRCTIYRGEEIGVYRNRTHHSLLSLTRSGLAGYTSQSAGPHYIHIHALLTITSAVLRKFLWLNLIKHFLLFSTVSFQVIQVNEICSVSSGVALKDIWKAIDDRELDMLLLICNHFLWVSNDDLQFCKECNRGSFHFVMR